MKIWNYCFASTLAMILCGVPGSASLAAADGGGACVHRPAPAGAIGKRVAVVVGNGAYANGIPALPNPTHDAEAISKTIGALGFEVFLSTNADSGALQKCLNQAYAGLAKADVAMLYYSGHGIQIKDENYLVATDAGTRDLKHGFVAVQPIVDALQKQAKATLVLLDACRNNPLAQEEGTQAGLSVSTGRGLGRIKDADAGKTPVAGTPGAVQARGLMVAYATSPNAVAQDGTGDLSPFTGAFVKIVGTSGYSIQRVMSDVNQSVGQETDWGQTPWMKSSLTDELKLGGGQTLDEARSLSDNHAVRAMELLNNQGKVQAATIEALKGLPAAPDEAALKRFPKAYAAVYSAAQSRATALPLSPGRAQVAVSTQDRVAVFKQEGGVTAGSLELWSASAKKLVATLPVTDLYKVAFSPHGKLLVSQSSRGGLSVFNGIDGSKLYDIRAGAFANSVEFSPDETRLMIAGNGFVIVDAATAKPTMVVKAAQLSAGSKKARSATLAQAVYGGDDKICFILNQGIRKGMVGVYDLKENKTVRLRETEDSVTVLACDPAGKYMIRTFAVGTGTQGMEIWDLVNDKVSHVNAASIVNISGIDPKGNYVGAVAFSGDADGLYDLATGKKGHPPTVPDGFSIHGSRVYAADGSMINEDLAPNPWRDWPDETLFGSALVAKAMAGLTAAQREEIARERITYSVVAGNP